MSKREKQRRKETLKSIGFLVLMFIVINSFFFVGSILSEKGIEKYDNFCISNGNEKFLSIDSGHIKCYREDKIAIYEEYFENYYYQIGGLLQFFIVFNVFIVIGGAMLFLLRFD